ncbi:hypothetical protein BDW69DRAFT_174193 [Aspergillus filifer]
MTAIMHEALELPLSRLNAQNHIRDKTLKTLITQVALWIICGGHELYHFMDVNQRDSEGQPLNSRPRSANSESVYKGPPGSWD